MSTSKAYAAVAVNHVALTDLLRRRPGQDVLAGVDVGKFHLLVVLRWPDGSFDRPWRVGNPDQIPVLVDHLARLGQQAGVSVALEPSGTYGDALRQALADAGLAVVRVSPKAAHDYAEVFDGVPSQHDGKDAAVVAELAALGKCDPSPCAAPRPAWQQELSYWVDWQEMHTGQLAVWAGRLEGLLGRHWPEVTRLLSVTSATLLRALAHWGDPGLLAADGQAADRLAAWGGRYLSGERIAGVLASARSTVGVRLGAVERQRLQAYAAQALQARRQILLARRQLRRLAGAQPALQGQAQAVGAVTACVLWAALGDPHDYPCGAAYRKAMGLNLVERSSGTERGRLHLSKRGDATVRRWLYLAALRLLKADGVRGWYQAKKARDGGRAGRAVVGVMRKLALALYQVGARGADFRASRLFAAVV